MSVQALERTMNVPDKKTHSCSVNGNYIQKIAYIYIKTHEGSSY